MQLCNKLQNKIILCFLLLHFLVDIQMKTFKTKIRYSTQQYATKTVTKHVKTFHNFIG